MKKVLLTGITGQAGSYLAEILLNNNYDVHGLIRRGSTFTTERIEMLFDHPHFSLHYGDLADGLNIYHLIQDIYPDYIINAGAMSHVRVSFDIPVYCTDVTGTGVLRILESIRQINPKIKFIQFSSSEMFGNTTDIIQCEDSPMHPCSPYAISKYMGYLFTKQYRDSYNIWASNAICFNMESPRRGRTFVTQKICDYIKTIRSSYHTIPLILGNLDARRDWGSCEEYMQGVHQMMNLDQPEDIIFATGETHSVREFVEVAFSEIGIQIKWMGSGLNEEGIDCRTGAALIKIHQKHFRPLELNVLCGNPLKAKKILHWEPKMKFKELIKCMLK